MTNDSDPSSAAYRRECGYGRLDAFEALKLTVEDYGGTLRQSFTIAEDWRITSDLDLRGLDLTIAAGATVTLDGGSLNLGNEDGTPAKIFVAGSLVGDPATGGTITCETGSEVIVEGGFLDKEHLDIPMDCLGACLMALDGGRIHFGPGTHTFSNGAFLVNNGGTMTFAPGAEVVLEDLAGDPWDRFEAGPGSVFRFGADARITVRNWPLIVGTAAEPVVFEGDNLASGETWKGLVIEGDSAEVTYAEISDAVWGLTLRARGAVLDHLTLSGNGLLTDYTAVVCIPSGHCNPIRRSELALSNATITGAVAQDANTGHGLVLRNADVSVTDTEVSGNDGYGVVVWNADARPFTGNTVSGNGFPTATVPTSEDGILVHSNGLLRLAPFSQQGLNVVSGNSRNQINALSGGFLFLGHGDGFSVEGWNTVTAGSGGSTLVRNSSGSPVAAEYTWWGSAAGPPSGAFAGPDSVDADPFLTENPIDPCAGNGPSCRPAGKTQAQPGAQRGEPVDFESLHAELVALRDTLAQTPQAPQAPDWVRALYTLQRLDATDALGEYGATMALLTTLRQNLDDGSTPQALRRTGEAALAAEVAEALLREEYDGAEALLATYGNSGVEEGWLALTLSAVAMHEQAERYEPALALLAEAAVLAPEQAAELALIAALIAENPASAARSTGDPSQTPASLAATSRTDPALPTEVALRAAYPNPAARGATVPFDLPEAAEVRVVVYDLLGREVALLAEGLHEAGRHEADFDASRLASGVYVIRAEVALTGGSARAFTQKLTLLK